MPCRMQDHLCDLRPSASDFDMTICQSGRLACLRRCATTLLCNIVGMERNEKTPVEKDAHSRSGHSSAGTIRDDMGGQVGWSGRVSPAQAHIAEVGVENGTKKMKLINYSSGLFVFPHHPLLLHTSPTSHPIPSHLIPTHPVHPSLEPPTSTSTSRHHLLLHDCHSSSW